MDGSAGRDGRKPLSGERRSYVPPCSAEGEPIVFGEEPELAPGVRGYAIASGGKVYIPAIHADEEGSGAVGRFLDSLAPHCRIPNVISGRLAGMLQRRGWFLEQEWSEEFQESVGVWAPPGEPS